MKGSIGSMKESFIELFPEDVRAKLSLYDIDRIWNNLNDRYILTPDPFGFHAHNTGHPTHSRNQLHYCNDWDGLAICSDCEEFKCCLCFTNPMIK